MINFDTINGQLCIMTEHVPLTPEAKFPCVVRLIQDDSPMGRLNKRNRSTNIEQDIKYICVSTRNSVMQTESDSVMALEAYEVIGYPVADHSEEWAAWRMMQGDKVINRMYPYFIRSDGKIVCSRDRNEKSPCYDSIDDWLEDWKDDDQTWQIYAEPKPLLADAKVGDLCQRRDGTYDQIADANYNNNVFRGIPHCIKMVGGMCCPLSGEYINFFDNGIHVDNPNDIISTEPLAPEGSAEWALQMMRLGKCVCHVKAESIKYHRPTHYVKRVVRENCTDDMSDAVWMKGADPTGWQLYEPKQEPVADCQRCTKLSSCSKSSPSIDHCVDYVLAEPAPKPTEPAFANVKVGDWVTDGVITGEIISIGCGFAWVKCNDSEYYIGTSNLEAISPSEVIIHIGCLSGTVERYNMRNFKLCHPDTHFEYSIIYKGALDAPTRELVESLLKAQQKGE